MLVLARSALILQPAGGKLKKDKEKHGKSWIIVNSVLKMQHIPYKILNFDTQYLQVELIKDHDTHTLR